MPSTQEVNERLGSYVVNLPATAAAVSCSRSSAWWKSQRQARKYAETMGWALVQRTLSCWACAVEMPPESTINCLACPPEPPRKRTEESPREDLQLGRDSYIDSGRKL